MGDRSAARTCAPHPAERRRDLPARSGTAVLTSPLERCRRTVAPPAAALGLEAVVDERFGECDYGAWTGRSLEEFREEPEWPVVRQHPSAARFGVPAAARIAA